uniref:SH3 domain-containing protein 2 n=1 Tax=Cicer arietinum TaxID=3827 RepID=A0A3Q7XX56_CICAR|nr:SH3 domain-containing protein 2 [Cicer arietinum]
MDAIRKQASRLREQVAKQQQAILRQLGQLSNEHLMADESEVECHQKLQKLYTSTKTAKHFQRHIVRGIEGFISVSSKQMEIVRKLAKDCYKYGTENENRGSDYPLARPSLQFSNSYDILENERETLLGILGDQISEPLRAQITGAPLEDARHLTHNYDKLRQEVEAQAAEVLRRRSKLRDSSLSADGSMRLQNAEKRLKELKSSLVALGREATSAMLSVEEQQQHITLQSLSTMVDAERAFHRHALVILDKLYAEMIDERQPNDSTSFPPPKDGHTQPADEKANLNGFHYKHNTETGTYFFGKVIHPFDAQAEGELSLSVDDYVVVRQVFFQSLLSQYCLIFVWFLNLKPIVLNPLLWQVDAERAFHRHALVILDKLYAEMIDERQPNDSTSFPPPKDGHTQPADEKANLNGFHYKHNTETGTYFFGKVIHPFDAQAEGELSLSVDDYVVVRQVAANGWSEGECNGNAGWFPSAYVQRQDIVQANKIME